MNELLGVVAGDLLLLLLDVVDNGVLLFVLLHLLDGRYEGEGNGLDVAGVVAGDLLDLFLLDVVDDGVYALLVVEAGDLLDFLLSVLVVDVLLVDLLDLLVG